MITTIFKLFKYSPLLQTLISYVCFCIIAVLILSWQLYSHSLSASFSETIPHLTIKLKNNSFNHLTQTKQVLAKIPGIKVISPFYSTKDTLTIESVEIYSSGKVKQTGFIEIIGSDLSKFPFVIPFENTRGLGKKNYTNAYTSKELALELMENTKAAIVNQALANMFSTPDPVIEDEYIVFKSNLKSQTGDPIKIIGVMKDLQDIPKLFTNLRTAQQMTDQKHPNGFYLRLELDNKSVDILEIVQGKIINALINKGIADFRISNWKEGDNKQQRIFSVFRIVIITVLISILLLSIFAGVLGIFRTFVIKQQSITILLRLGTSKRALFATLAVVNSCSLCLGTLLSYCTIRYFEDPLSNIFLEGLQQIVYIHQLQINWWEIILCILTIFVGYMFIFMTALNHIINNKQPVKI